MPLNYTSAKKLISGGQFVRVSFVKRSTQSDRHMVCRTGVTKGLKGGSLPYNPVEKQTLTVYDVRAKGHRSIPVDSIFEIKRGGEIVYSA